MAMLEQTGFSNSPYGLNAHDIICYCFCVYFGHWGQTLSFSRLTREHELNVLPEQNVIYSIQCTHPA